MTRLSIARLSAVTVIIAATGLSACASQRFWERDQLVAAPSPCATQRFDIYFTEAQARLTQPARDAIGLHAARLQSCRIDSVRVLGLASATGDSDVNQALSVQRATTVTEALTAAGWPAPAFTLEAAGDTGAVTGGVAEPLRRRTEVVVEASPR